MKQRAQFAWGVSWIFSLLAVTACSSLRGVQGVQHPAPFELSDQRSSDYRKVLEKWSRSGEYYADFTVKMALVAIWLSDEMKEEFQKELKKTYPNGVFPPASQQAYESLFPEGCPTPVLVRAWDHTRNEDPLKISPRSWEFYSHHQTAVSFQKLRDLESVLDRYFPVSPWFGDWHLVCMPDVAHLSSPQFSGGRARAELYVTSPAGSILLLWGG